jgi:hypothetical protein
LAIVPRLARQHQERGLERILGVLFMPQEVPAHSKNKPTVALDEGLEGKLVSVQRQGPQELAVGEVPGRRNGQPVHALQDWRHLDSGHV